MTILRRLLNGGQPSGAEVASLTPDEARRLRPSLVGRFSSERIAQQAEAHPDLAFGVPGQNHYGIGGLWRQREEIGEIVEISRGPYRRLILDRMLDAFAARNVALVVLDFEESANGGGFYSEHGFVAVDRIVEYERRIGDGGGRTTHDASVRPYRDADFDAVLEVDHRSFPWLWWNSADELDAYLATPGVRILVSLEGDRPVGYAGLTIRGTFAHLDRLAVHESHQRRGHGAALVTYLLDYLGSIGVQRIALSTQEDNYRSQSLYERFGFTRGRWTYDIRGIWLREPLAS